MQSIHINDMAWQEAFLHIVHPLPDEWLLGLLLRCDEVNHWESGTTFWLVTTACSKRDKLRWKRNMRKTQHWKRNIPSFMTPSLVNMSSLAMYLGTTTRQLEATTYHEERARCFALGALAIALVSLNISPHEILMQDEPNPHIPLKKLDFDTRSILTFLLYATSSSEQNGASEEISA